MIGGSNHQNKEFGKCWLQLFQMTDSRKVQDSNREVTAVVAEVARKLEQEVEWIVTKVIS